MKWEVSLPHLRDTFKSELYINRDARGFPGLGGAGVPWEVLQTELETVCDHTEI